MTGGRIVLTDDAQAIETRHLGFTISPHEECGVEEAVRLVEANGGESVVLTLGPAEAEEQLRDAMAIGIDRAIHLVTDGEEWDPQATAGAIVDAIRADEAETAPFDLVFFGNEAADAGNYQVGIRVAHALGRPVATGLKGVTVDGGAVRCEQEVAGGRDVYELPLPAVVTVKEGLNLPRYPSVPGRLRAQRKPVAATTPAAARVAAREAAARRPGGPGQAGRDPRPRAGRRPARRRGAAADRGGRRDRPRLPRARGRRGRRRSLQALTFARALRPAATVQARRWLDSVASADGALAGHGVETLHVAEHDAFALVRAARRSPQAIVELAERLGATAVVGPGTERGQRGPRARRRAARRCRSPRTASPRTPATPAPGDARRAGEGACSRRRDIHAPTALLTVQPHAVAVERRGAEPAVETFAPDALRRRPASCASSSGSRRATGGISLADAKVVVSRRSRRGLGGGVRDRSRSSPACSAARSGARAR